MLTDNEVTHSWVELMPYPFLFDCEECAFEAWEHQTYGGVGVDNEPDVAGENACPAFLPPHFEPRYEDWRRDAVR